MMALRYAAGYVPRSLLKKLPKSTNPIKQGLQLCLWDLLDHEHEGGTAESWIQAVDRGGLTRVNEMTFQRANNFKNYLLIYTFESGVSFVLMPGWRGLSRKQQNPSKEQGPSEETQF